MQEQINQLEQKVAELERKLEGSLSITGMNYDLKEIIRNEVIKQEDSVTPVTFSYQVTAGEFIDLPVNPTGILIFKWREREYKIPYLS